MIYFLLFVVILMSIAIYNLYKKILTYEKIVQDYETFIEYNVLEQLNNCINKLNEVDNKGAFKSDDEVGFIWNDILRIVKETEKYINYSYNGEENA